MHVMLLNNFPQPITLTPPPCVLQLGVEYHKRFDPIYSDACNRTCILCPFRCFHVNMAQCMHHTHCCQ